MRTGRHRAPPGPLVAATASLAQLVWPVTCAGCGLDDVALCRGCLRSLVGPPASVSPLTAADAPPTWAATAYADVPRELVLAWKERGRHDLAAPLAAALRRAAGAALPRGAPAAGVALVPMPSARAAVRARGGDLVADLAVRCAWSLRRLGMPVRVEPVLVLRRGAGEQVGRGAAARRAGRSGVLRLRAPAPTTCLLVDDVVTTGSTLAEARAVLETAGGRVLAAATVAATPGRPR